MQLDFGRSVLPKWAKFAGDLKLNSFSKPKVMGSSVRSLASYSNEAIRSWVSRWSQAAKISEY